MIETLEVKSVAPAPPKNAAPEIPPALKEAFDQSPLGKGKIQAEIALPKDAGPEVGQQIGKALVKGLKAHAANSKEDAWGAGFELAEGLIRLWWSRRRKKKERAEGR